MSKTSPVYFGAGSCKVSVYSPTQSLPYYRLCYRVGGRRYQRTRKTFEEAEESAKAILSQLREGRVSVAQITQMDVSVLGVARSELAELGLRLDQAINEYTDARRRLGEIALSEAVKCYQQYHPTSLRRVAFSGGLGYADPMEYEHRWSRAVHGTMCPQPEPLPHKSSVCLNLEEWSDQGWELVTVLRNPHFVDHTFLPAGIRAATW